MTLAEELRPLLARAWLLIGVGSDLRGDDAFGPVLARRLAEEGLPALDGGTSPESLTGPILRSGAEVLLFADVGNLGAPAGSLRLLPASAVPPGGSSTHDPSLGLLVAYLEAQRPFTARILAVEPARMGLGEPVSAEVAAAVDAAVEAFRAARLRCSASALPPTARAAHGAGAGRRRGHKRARPQGSRW
jgi:hydrogenase maturation protease